MQEERDVPGATRDALNGEDVAVGAYYAVLFQWVTRQSDLCVGQCGCTGGSVTADHACHMLCCFSG